MKTGVIVGIFSDPGNELLGKLSVLQASFYVEPIPSMSGGSSYLLVLINFLISFVLLGCRGMYFGAAVAGQVDDPPR